MENLLFGFPGFPRAVISTDLPPSLTNGCLSVIRAFAVPQERKQLRLLAADAIGKRCAVRADLFRVARDTTTDPKTSVLVTNIRKSIFRRLWDSGIIILSDCAKSQSRTAIG
jgi:hypothetical protein